MAGDRRAALIVRAAARGVVDFSEFAPTDRKWWMRLNWLLDEVETEDAARYAEARHRQHCAALNVLAPKNYTHHWEEAGKELNSLRSVLFPWDSAAKHKTTSEEAAKAQYLSIVGDPKKDPEVAEKLRKTVEYLKSLGRGAAERRRNKNKISRPVVRKKR